MYLPDVPYAIQRYTAEIMQLRGINFSDNFIDGELTMSQNISAKKWPYLTTRNSRGTVYKKDGTPYSGATAIFAWDKLAVIENGTIYYDGEEIGTVSPGEKQFAIVNSSLIIWPDKIMVNLQEGTTKDMVARISETQTVKFTFTHNSLQIPEENYLGDSFSNIGYHNNNYAVKKYTEVSFENGAWVKTGEELIPLFQLKVGDLLIPYKTNAGAYLPNYASNPGPSLPTGFQHQDNTDGVFMQVTEITKNDVSGTEEGYTGSFWYNFKLFTSGESKKLSEYYKASDSLTISGCEWEDNNVKSATILGIDDDTRTITFPDHTFWFPKKDGYLVQKVEQSQESYTAYLEEWIGEPEAGTKYSRDKGEIWEVTGSGRSEDPSGTLHTYLILKGDTEILPGDKLYEYQESWQDTGMVSVQKAFPEMDFICESQNRLWGCSSQDRTIYASALGLPDQFYAFDGLSTDSYAVAVATSEPFTGCCQLGSSVLFWKETKLHKILGSFPSEYSLYTYNLEGLKEGCHKSMQVINDVLYYVGLHGVNIYSGGTPQCISNNFGDFDFSHAAAGSDGNRYYLSVKTENVKNLFVYDRKEGIWLREEECYCPQFARVGKNLYCIDESTGGILLLDSGKIDPAIHWMAEFTPFYETIEGRKQHRKLRIRVDLPFKSYLVVEIKTDNDLWTEVAKIIGHTSDVSQIQIPIRRCDKFQLRLSGKGPCTILSIQRQFAMGSDR